MIPDSPTPRPQVRLSDGYEERDYFDVRIELEEVRDWLLNYPDDTAVEREIHNLLQFIQKAELLYPNDTPLPEKSAERARLRLLEPDTNLGNWESRLLGARIPEGPRRWMVRDLWPWGTTPLLSGQPKAGKTTLVAELVASIAIPGRRFLGHFDPVELTGDERSYGVTIISAEGAPEDYERELIRLGIDNDARDQALVILYHLEAEGLNFDLTDAAIFNEWLLRLAICDNCDGSDDMVPTVIIVDGITAILANAGKGVEHYSKWVAAFRRLQRELGTPNGLIVGHSTRKGDHPLGNTEGAAQSDGLWNYTAKSSSPSALRYFEVTPRLGGTAIPKTRVDRLDGRLQLISRANYRQDDATPAPWENSRQITDYGTRMADFIRDYHEETGGWPKGADLRRAGVPQSRFSSVRDDLIERGILIAEKLKLRGGGTIYRLSDHDPNSTEMEVTDA